jgi:hypothetical protein
LLGSGVLLATIDELRESVSCWLYVKQQAASNDSGDADCDD